MRVVVVVLNWNGISDTVECIASLRKQTKKHTIVVVDNGSVDESDTVLASLEDIIVLKQPKNLGFAGGVNVGIRWAIEHNYEAVTLLNNDAVVERNWLQKLTETLGKDPSVAIVTSKIRHFQDLTLDSTGDYYTTWLLPYPRGRSELDTGQYDTLTHIIGASGGASIYRIKTLKEIGLFDEDFFAYYEDVDISLRAILAGWNIRFEPQAIVRHKIGATSGKIKGFTTFQTTKNYPLLALKNVPTPLLIKYGWKFLIAYGLFVLRAGLRLQIKEIVRGIAVCCILTPKKFSERRHIQRSRKLSSKVFDALLVHDLPPNARSLRLLRYVVSLGRIHR